MSFCQLQILEHFFSNYFQIKLRVLLTKTHKKMILDLLIFSAILIIGCIMSIGMKNN